MGELAKAIAALIAGLLQVLAYFGVTPGDEIVNFGTALIIFVLWLLARKPKTGS